MDNKFRLLLHLGKNQHKAYTMHELSKTLNIPYATFHRTVQQLQELLAIETVGKAKTIRLGTNDIIHAYLCIASHEEKKDYLAQHPVIKLLTQDLRTKDVVILFGSYAKGTNTKASDVDLIVINKQGRASIPFSKLEHTLGVTINPLFLTPQEYRGMLRDDEENVGKQALKHHIILNNPETFWRLALDARRA